MRSFSLSMKSIAIYATVKIVQRLPGDGLLMDLAPRQYFDLGLAPIHFHCTGNTYHFALKCDGRPVTGQFRPSRDVGGEGLIRVFAPLHFSGWAAIQICESILRSGDSVRAKVIHNAA